MVVCIRRKVLNLLFACADERQVTDRSGNFFLRSNQRTTHATCRTLALHTGRYTCFSQPFHHPFTCRAYTRLAVAKR